MDQRIARLLAWKSGLLRMVDHCAAGTISECRVIETRADTSREHGSLA